MYQSNRQFRHLIIGDTFDWINDAEPMYNSFYLRCEKVSARKYKDETGVVHCVGSINADVYHVKECLPRAV